MILNILFLISGMALLYFGGDWLVDGSSNFARRLGVRPMVIGLTIVAFGTSCPELLVSTISALQGEPSVALGNVVGSNFTNIALILGLAALLKPIIVNPSSLRREWPITVITALLVLGCCWDLKIARWEGILLVLGLVAFIWWAVWDAKQEKKHRGANAVNSAEIEPLPEVKSMGKCLLLIAAGLVGLAGGAKLLVDGAVGIARVFGISELVIGLTIVALGTSLPELAASVIGILKGEDDIAVGNILGSNIFNILGVLGISTAIQPIGIESLALYRDIPIMIGMTLLLGLLMRPGYVISRFRGALMLLCYIVYTVYIFVV